MTEQPDKDSKTEEASPRRIEEALKKGNTPFSREAGNFATLLTLGLTLPLTAPWAGGHMAHALSAFIDRPYDFDVGLAPNLVLLGWRVSWMMIWLLGPILLVLMVAGILASGLQNPPRFVLHRIKPDFSRLSPSKGLARILGAHGRVDVVKSLFKIVLVCSVFYMFLKGGARRIAGYISMRNDQIPANVASEISSLFLTVGLCIGGVALIDLVWSRLKWRLDLRMSLQELKDEQKQAEGDPAVKARQRSIARERARQRMIAAVPRATVVIANPTHYAVALRYVHGETAVPLVIARGIDHLALRIRTLAEENDIPVIEDRMLARSLYDVVRTDRPIPPEFYRAVAEIILHLMSRRDARPIQPGTSPAA